MMDLDTEAMNLFRSAAANYPASETAQAVYLASRTKEHDELHDAVINLHNNTPAVSRIRNEMIAAHLASGNKEAPIYDLKTVRGAVKLITGRSTIYRGLNEEQVKEILAMYENEVKMGKMDEIDYATEVDIKYLGYRDIEGGY